jgi:hypothetical protein
MFLALRSFPALVGVAASRASQLLTGALGCAPVLASRNRSQPSPVTAPLRVDSQPPDYYHAVALVYRPQRYPGALNVFVSDDADFTWRRYWRYLACRWRFFPPGSGRPSSDSFSRVRACTSKFTDDCALPSPGKGTLDSSQAAV